MQLNFASFPFTSVCVSSKKIRTTIAFAEICVANATSGGEPNNDRVDSSGQLSGNAGTIETTTTTKRRCVLRREYPRRKERAKGEQSPGVAAFRLAATATHAENGGERRRMK